MRFPSRPLKYRSHMSSRLTPNSLQILPRVTDSSMSTCASNATDVLLYCFVLLYSTRDHKSHALTQVSGDATYCTLEDILPAGSGGNIKSNLPEVAAGGVLIGKPLPNVHVSVVDSELNPFRLGEPGELLVGGVAVALGYHRRPLETAEKFRRSSGSNSNQRQDAAVHVPGLAVGVRVVRTGDRVIQSSADGPLYWLGRMNSEVSGCACFMQQNFAW